MSWRKKKNGISPFDIRDPLVDFQGVKIPKTKPKKNKEEEACIHFHRSLLLWWGLKWGYLYLLVPLINWYHSFYPITCDTCS